jgi:uncharacterized protein (DUF2252 family)
VTKNIVERLTEFNADRIPVMRALKYKNMRAGSLAFLRGSCHLFYEDWPADSALNAAPLSWVCGDLHLENFGSYLGPDRQVYFDINDFDEGALAPCTWDVARFVTSLILAGNTQHLSDGNIQELCAVFLDTYFASLESGQVHPIERENASGLVKKLMHALKERERDEFLNERSKKTKLGRKFRRDYVHFLPVVEDEREMVTNLISKLAVDEEEPEFFRVHDIAFRIAGTGSLGIRRYVALIEGKGSPDKNFILDIKEARCSALTPFLQTPQPAWKNQAGRVITIQKLMQGLAPALLTSAAANGKPFIVKEYQPQQDRISLVDWAEKITQAQELITTMAKILACGELRSAGKQGAAAVNDLVMFGKQTAIKAEVLDYAKNYAKKARKDFEAFSKAYDQGLFL